MPYANNDGVGIYYEVEGEGPPLVLMQGITNAIEPWRYFGYVEPLKSDYQLVLIDTRGHGASDKPHEPEAYQRRVLVSDVLVVFDDLGIAKAHYLGFSMGGYIGYGIASDAPRRFYSLIFEDAILPWDRDPGLSAQALEDFGFNKPMGDFMVGIEAMAGQWWSPAMEAMERSNDLQALAAMLMAEEGILSYGLGESVPDLTMPCLFLAGEAEGAPDTREYIEGMPNATYVGFSDLGHVDTFARSDLMVPHIRRFLADVGEG